MITVPSASKMLVDIPDRERYNMPCVESVWYRPNAATESLCRGWKRGAGHGREVSAPEHLSKTVVLRLGVESASQRYGGMSERHMPLTWVVPRTMFRPMQTHGAFYYL